MPNNETRINNLLDQRLKKNSYRSIIKNADELIDFASNDYLGLARSQKLKEGITHTYLEAAGAKNGATGSRLLTGTSTILQETEDHLSELLKAPAGLLFSSGYMANLAFFSSVPQKGDTILYDELSHACIKDGCRLSLADRFPYRHNDLNHLESKLQRATGEIYIACESVYSMDGDFAPLGALGALAELYGAKLVVDEAHSTGVFGDKGNGLVNQLGLRESVYAVIYTFGKAMGVHGAFISGTPGLREFLINFARPFIYTTAPGDFECIAISQSFHHLTINTGLQQLLEERIALFRNLTRGRLLLTESNSSIQAVFVPENDKVKEASNSLKQSGFDVRPILAPTVKESTERLRICLHSYNTEQEVAQLVKTMITCLS